MTVQDKILAHNKYPCYLKSLNSGEVYIVHGWYNAGEVLTDSFTSGFKISIYKTGETANLLYPLEFLPENNWEIITGIQAEVYEL